jgi:alkylation response protein AidB-like acyl-CoA dehydrogenase
MRERKQFGVPLGSFQAVQHMLADMLTHVDAARLTTYEGLSLAALGRPFEAAAAIAGFVAGRSYERVTVDAAQLHGGIGAATEHPLHHYYRRGKGMRLRLGTVASQLDRVVDGAVLGGSPGPWRRPTRATAELRG